MPDPRKELLARVTALIDRNQGVAIASPVDTGYFSVEPETVRGILDLFAETADLLRDIGAYFETQGAGDVDEITAEDDTDFLREIGASISTELASREVADLAFMGCSEILDIHRELRAAAEEQSFWKIVAHADAGLGRAAQALIPIESAMREYEGLPAMRRRWENIDDSLEIRRQYDMLWRAVQRAGNPAADEIETAIRKIGHRIAILRRLKIYPLLRVDDRLSIRKLQKRVFAYLEQPGEVDGHSLWQDLVAFFGLLRQVNNRHELREHDRQLVLTIHYELGRKIAVRDRMPPEILERLDPLLGRDDDLDRILRSPGDFRPRDCLAVLERLRDELLGAEVPSPVSL